MGSVVKQDLGFVLRTYSTGWLDFCSINDAKVIIQGILCGKFIMLVK